MTLIIHRRFLSPKFRPSPSFATSFIEHDACFLRFYASIARLCYQATPKSFPDISAAATRKISAPQPNAVTAILRLDGRHTLAAACLFRRGRRRPRHAHAFRASRNVVIRKRRRCIRRFLHVMPAATMMTPSTNTPPSASEPAYLLYFHALANYFAYASPRRCPHAITHASRWPAHAHAFQR